MEIQIRISSEHEYLCVLIFVCLSNTIIVKNENRQKHAKEAFIYNRETAHVEITIVGIRIIGLKPWRILSCYFYIIFKHNRQIL